MTDRSSSPRYGWELSVPVDVVVDNESTDAAVLVFLRFVDFRRGALGISGCGAVVGFDLAFVEALAGMSVSDNSRRLCSSNRYLWGLGRRGWGVIIGRQGRIPHQHKTPFDI